MTAAAAVRALPAAGRTARYGHVLAGVELDGPAREALASPVPAPRKVPERVSPARDAVAPLIDAMLAGDLEAPRKQRRGELRRGRRGGRRLMPRNGLAASGAWLGSQPLISATQSSIAGASLSRGGGSEALPRRRSRRTSRVRRGRVVSPLSSEPGA